MTIPEYFLKELAFIDRTYRVEPVQDGPGYYIVKDIDLTLRFDGGESLILPDAKKEARVHGPLVVLWIPEIGGMALDKIREMKRQAIEMKIMEDPLAELAFYQAQRKETKEKKLDKAADMITEGIMEMKRLSQKQSWSYGGSTQEKSDGK